MHWLCSRQAQMPHNLESAIVVDNTPTSRPDNMPDLRSELFALLQLPFSKIRTLRDANDWLEPFIPNKEQRGFLLTSFVPAKGRWRCIDETGCPRRAAAETELVCSYD